MKKFIYPTIVALVAVVTMSFLPTPPGKPKLFPAIEQYLTSVGNIAIPEKHNLAIKHLEVAINSSIGGKEVSILFTCPDNSFRSQAAQVLLQSLITANDIKKVNVISAGNTAGEIDPRLIKILTSVGYKVSPVTANGKSGYQITFGDKFAPITLYAKNTSDPEVGHAGFYLFKTCDQQESGCNDITGALFKDQLAYNNPASIKEEKELQDEFNMIAKEMSYIVAESLK
jgi:hypothetical protein